MKRTQKLYSLQAVDNYVLSLSDVDTDIIPGLLIDTIIIYHDNITEVFEETYLNAWDSAYIRHIYRAGLPKRFTKALQAMEA